MKYIVKNCPALSYGKGLRFKKCCHTNWKEYCKDCDNCVMKQLYNKFKNCSCELINLLEIEEVE